VKNSHNFRKKKNGKTERVEKWRTKNKHENENIDGWWIMGIYEQKMIMQGSMAMINNGVGDEKRL